MKRQNLKYWRWNPSMGMIWHELQPTDCVCARSPTLYLLGAVRCLRAVSLHLQISADVSSAYANVEDCCLHTFSDIWRKCWVVSGGWTLGKTVHDHSNLIWLSFSRSYGICRFVHTGEPGAHGIGNMPSRHWSGGLVAFNIPICSSQYGFLVCKVTLDIYTRCYHNLFKATLAFSFLKNYNLEVTLMSDQTSLL